MSNFINPQVLAAESLVQLSHSLVAGALVYRDRSEDFSMSRGHKVGESVTIRTVSELETTEFTGTTETQEIQQSSTQLTIEKHFDVSIEVGAKERALNLDGVREEVVNPAMISMAQKVDTYLLTKMKESQGLFTSANLLENAREIANARRSANLQQIAKPMRMGLVNDELEVQLLGQDAFTRFDIRGEAATTALQEASMGRLMGIDWFSSVNMENLITTPSNGVSTLDNAIATSNLQGNSSLVVDSTTGTFNAGDKIQIAGAKRAFTVLANVTAGSTAIPIVEQINENLKSLDGNAITTISAGVQVQHQGVIFTPSAFGFAAPPLDEAAGDKTGIVSAEGMSVRVTEAYDWDTKKTYWSFDMLIGAKAIDSRKSMLLGKI